MPQHYFKQTPTEYEVQRVAHTVLAEHYQKVRGELIIKRPNMRGCRFDLVVFDENDNVLFTVEVKRNPNATRHAKKDYYEQVCGAPSVLIAGMEQALDAVTVVQGQLAG